MNRFTTRVDIHQHLWPEPLISALRARRRPPRLRGWTLQVDGEPDFEVDPADHDVAARVQLAARDGLDRVVVSLSSPLGIESLPRAEARDLLTAWHEGAAGLPAPFDAWASPALTDADAGAGALASVLATGFAGLQMPATALLDRPGYDRAAAVLGLAEHRQLPLLVHPGPATPAGGEVPAWWPALVPYVQQMHAAWFAWRVHGRPRHPRLRVCFAMLAGLAPLHGERFAMRSGERTSVDPDVFLDVSSYGTRAIDAMVRVLGIDALVHGSDRPYAEPPAPDLGDAAAHAIAVTNPSRLLTRPEVDLGLASPAPA